MLSHGGGLLLGPLLEFSGLVLRALPQLGGRDLDGRRLLGEARLGLGPALFDLFPRFGEEPVGLRLRFGYHLRGHLVRAVQDPGGLGSQCRGERGLVENRMGGAVLGVGQLVEQLPLPVGHAPEAHGHRLEVGPDLAGVEALAHGPEGVTGHLIGGQMG